MTEESIKKILLAGMGLAVIVLLVMIINLPKMPSQVAEGEKAADSDSDGLNDKIEKALGTDPANKDSDNDGYEDLEEIKNGFDPLNKSSDAKLGKDAAAAMRSIIEQMDPELYKARF